MEWIGAFRRTLWGNRTGAASDRATIIYTSGTTGSRKGVMHHVGTLAFDAVTLRENSFSVPRLLLKFQQGVFHKITKEELEHG